MIKSFKNKEAQQLFVRQPVRKFPRSIQRVAMRKLWLIDAAGTLHELRTPPGNRLEPLTGSRKGHHSIRINRKWRICFAWKGGDAYHVEITDYH